MKNNNIVVSTPIVDMQPVIIYCMYTVYGIDLKVPGIQFFVNSLFCDKPEPTAAFDQINLKVTLWW